MSKKIAVLLAFAALTQVPLVHASGDANALRSGALAQPVTEALGRAWCRDTLHGENFARTELFFGLSSALRPPISEEEFQTFVDIEVTPRFPDGLTLLTGSGQFQGSNKLPVKEGSKLLILLYPFSSKSNKAIEDIRAAYKAQFFQESVLRVDEQSCVSF